MNPVAAGNLRSSSPVNSVGASASTVFSGWTGVTRREGEVMAYIGWHCQAKRYSPTQGDIAAHLGLHHTRISQIIRALRVKGFVTGNPKARRSLRLTRDLDTSLIPVQLEQHGARCITEFHEMAGVSHPPEARPALAEINASSPPPAHPFSQVDHIAHASEIPSLSHSEGNREAFCDDGKTFRPDGQDVHG